MGEDIAPTLIRRYESAIGNTQDKLNVVQYSAGFCTEHSEKSRGIGYQEEKSPTLRAGVTPAVVLNDQGGSQMDVTEDRTGTIRAQEHGHQPIVLENHPNDSRVKIREDGTVQTLSEIQKIWESANDKTESVYGNTVVRRLTPLECTRLQGFPDGWVDIGDWVDSKGKKHKDADSPKYKALGNSIALPFWQWMAKRMVKILKNDGVEHPTMASLFDGIGGFPLVYSRCGCDPVWASEIEEFPIAVTKRRFKDDN